MTADVKRIMEALKCSKEEAEEIARCDKAIDHNEKMDFDLPPDKEKVAKKFSNVKDKKKPIQLERKPRERKANPTKGSIIAELAHFLQETSENACENVEITNKERQISFKIGENSYELTLVQKRKAKTGG